MLKKILKLGKEAAVYGLSSIVGRFLNFLLIPLYTNLLLTSEYGIVATLYSYMAFVQILYTYGMDAAYMRYVATLELGDEKQNFSVPFLSVLVTSTLFSALIQIFAAPIAVAAGLHAQHASLVRLAAMVMFFDALSLIPYTALRMEHKALTFALLRILNIVITIVVTLIFLGVFGMRSEGVFYANMFASFCTFISLLPVALRKLTFRFHTPLYRELLKFGLPYIPAGLAGIAMQVIDRPILKMLTDDATVGIYQANYRLGIFMMLVVGMFDYAWRPFFLEHAKDDDAKDLFSKIFTLFTSLMFGLFLAVAFFVDDLVRLSVHGRFFIGSAYWSGLTIVPWVLLAYIFLGWYVNFSVGVYLHKKTKFLPYVTGLGALINVGVNFWLIPRYDILGAAWATLLSYLIMAAGMYLVQMRLYPVSYEWKKIGLVALSAFVIFAFSRYFPLVPHDAASLAAKAGMLALFVLSLGVIKVVDLNQLRGVLARLRSR